MSDGRTLIDYLNSARKYLEEKGFENARGNAEALLGKALQLPRIELYVQHDRPLAETEVSTFRELLRRRVRHEPLQLILGEVEFFGVSLDVKPGLLIPRPETEELVEQVVDELRQLPRQGAVRVLDIGCGTGCITVALAACMPNIWVDAIDNDFEALTCTAANALKHDVSARVRTIRADLLDGRFLSWIVAPYDLVISNPPYVREKDLADLQPEVRTYEAKAALVGGESGLVFFEAIAANLDQLLKPNGMLALEVGQGQASAVVKLLANLVTAAVIKDASGIERIILGRRNS